MTGSIRRKGTWLALSLALTLLLAACGGGDDETDDTSGDEAEAVDDSTGGEEDDATGGDDTSEGGEEVSAGEITDETRAFYEGKTVRIVVVYGEGGGFDLTARAMAPAVSEYLGADVGVVNMPGAGGLLALNTVWEEDPDGLTVVFFSGQGVTGAVLGGADGVQFELPGYEYVARIVAEDRLMVGSLDSEFETIDDIIGADGFRFASAGPGGSDHIDANVLCAILDIGCDIITGYSGSAETGLAVASGDVDAASGTLKDRAQVVTDGDARPLLAIAGEPVDLFPDTPHLLGLDLDEDQLALAEAQLALQGMGYTMLAPPDTPADRVALLTEAFENAMNDEDVIARLEEQELETEGWLPGPELREIAESLMNSPPEFISILESSYDAG